MITYLSIYLSIYLYKTKRRGGSTKKTAIKLQQQNRNSQARIEKRRNGLRFTSRPTTKYRNYSSNKFY